VLAWIENIYTKKGATMLSFISKIADKFYSFTKGMHAKQIFSVVLVSSLLFTNHIGVTANSRVVTQKLDEVVHQNDSERPKTTGEWNKEAREVKGEPGERLKRIGKQSGEAVKEFGSIYPDTAQKSASELKNPSSTDKS
jgi:hypothetical protein